MTDQHLTPEEHSSKVGGSTAARRIGCPDSVRLEARVPKSRGSIYAREGTALHEMMALILQQSLDADAIAALLPFTFTGQDRDGDTVLENWSHTIDAETWADVGQTALDMFDTFCEGIERDYGDEMTMLIEVRGAFPGIPGAFGTSDVLWRCGTAGGCWDWKFGRTPVNAINNKQLKFYMNTGIYEHPKMFDGCVEYILNICQPLVNQYDPSEDVVGMEDLIAFREELQTAMTSTGMAEGSWCKFADCASICPLKTGKVARLGALIGELKAVEGGAVDETGAPLVDGFSFEDFLLEALELTEAAQQWAKVVAQMAHQQIDEKNMELPGWKTVAKQSSGNSWIVDDKKARGLLSRRGLAIEDYAPRTTISAPQAIKKLAAIKKELPASAFAKKPSSGTTLTREGDPRPSARTPAKRAADLAAAMATLADTTATPTESENQ